LPRERYSKPAPGMEAMSLGSKFSVEKVEGKDLGVIATVRIVRGERVLEEAPLFAVPRQYLPLEEGLGRKVAEGEVRKRVARLSDADRKTFWAMHDSHTIAGEKTAIGICRTNNFALNGQPNTMGCFPIGGRFNHSCRPNIVWYWSEQPGAKLVFHATREIQVGEELCISYCDIEASAARRKARLEKSHQFTCRCEVCCLSGPELERSDRLRGEYRELSRVVQQTFAREPQKALKSLDRVCEIINEELGGELWMCARAKNDAFHAAVFSRDLPLARRTMSDAIDAWVLAGGESDQTLLAKMRGYAADPTTHRLWCLGACRLWRGARRAAVQ